MNWSAMIDALLAGTLFMLVTGACGAVLTLLAAIVIRHRRKLRHPVTSLDNWWEDASPQRRIDFNFGNMGMLLGLMCPSLSIVLKGPVPNSALGMMSTGLQILMCVCIFGGCGMKLHGALSGRRFYFPGTPLKTCYRYGYSGAPIATMGALVYGWYILSNTENWSSALSGVSTPCFGIGISLQAVLYWLEYRRIQRNEPAALRDIRSAVRADERDRDSH